MGRKVFLKCKSITLLGVFNKFLETKSLLTTPSNVSPLHLKQTFPPIISILSEGDWIKSRLLFQNFSILSSEKMSTIVHSRGEGIKLGKIRSTQLLNDPLPSMALHPGVVINHCPAIACLNCFSKVFTKLHIVCTYTSESK